MLRLTIFFAALLVSCGQSSKPPTREQVDERGVMQAPVGNSAELTDRERMLKNRERLIVPLEERDEAQR